MSRLYGWWREIVAALIVLLSRLLTMPRTPWENDEFLFAEAVRRFDPSNYHPHPPGYPLFVLLGKAANTIVDDPWRALIVINVIAAPVGFLALAAAFRHWIEDRDLAVAGALIYYFSASMLVHGTLALADGAPIAFLALTLLALSTLTARRRLAGRTAAGPAAGDPATEAGGAPSEHERSAIAAGVWASAAIGCRPQLVIPMIPLLTVGLWQMRTHRQRFACIASFALVSLMWFLPLMDAAGGLQKLIVYEGKQAEYFAAHDAEMSRGARSSAAVAIRFIFHPWGSKYVSIPLFAAVFLGFPQVARRWRPLLGLLLFTLVQLLFELGWMDPADGARYSLPAMIFFALSAACGIGVIRQATQLRAVPLLAAAFLAGISVIYVWPIIRVRARMPSPVAAAAEYANRSLPADAVIAYELILRPHAEYLMPRFRQRSIEKAMTEFYERPDVPLVLFADGRSSSPDARVFQWPDSDAYGKLTRNHYREVSLDLIPPQERYLPLAGVYALERTIAGDEWRWLARDAAIRLPDRHGSHVTLGFRLSPDAPYETNPVRLTLGSKPVGEVIARKQTVLVSIAVPPGDATLGIHAEQSFVPATLLHNRDPRILAVQLVRVQSF